VNARFAALALLAAAACGSASSDYERALERAAREQARAGPEPAAAAYLDAARVAGSTRDRDEALYRAAAAYRRARRHDDAVRLLDDLAARDGERRARASFDRARLERERGGSFAEAERLLLAALRAHASSGLATHGLSEYLRAVELRAGLEGALARATDLVPEFAPTELDEPLRYQRARLLERSGELALARQAYLECAARHPYPRGALWDDALFAAARCAERLGDARGARATLERLLSEREEARGLGSYERARYAEARFHLGELHRDAFGDPTRARREFRRVFDEHPTSLLRDDALFQEALVARAQGDRAGTCAALELLEHELPESRFTRCAAELCPELRVKQDRPCPSYLLEALGSEARSDADQD
jgi:tetratricopeptide (TPR) repeat protein